VRRSTTISTTALTTVLALTGAGCGLMASPVHSTPEEVLDALFALQDGAEVRATAELMVDEDEVRDALRDDPEALELFQDAMADGEAEDVDELLADLEEAQAMLADHAVLLASGADGSARVAAEYRGTVWADLRVGTDLEADGDPAEGFRFDLQLQVDWATAAEVFDQPDLLGDLDEAAAEIAPFLGETPDMEPIQRLLIAFLGGEFVGIGGEIGPDLLSGLGLSGEDLTGATDPGGMLGLGGFGELDLDHRELAATALTFDGFRTDGDATLVDVTLEVRAAAELLLDELAENPGTMGMTFEDVEEARAELSELPERLVDVATLRFDGAGDLQQVRVDLVDVGLQLATAAEPEDDEVAAAARVAGQLDATGLFLVLDVEGVGIQTVLGDPTTTVTPEQMADALGALYFGALGALGAPVMPNPEQFEGFDELSESEQQAITGEIAVPQSGLRPDQLAVGDCFDDEALFGFAPEGAAPTVPCDQPHDNEAFATIDIGATNYDELLRDEPDAVACIDQEFEPYVGTSYDQSALIVDVLRPTQEQFEAGARTSVCYLYGFEPLTGSVAGTGS